METLKSFLKRYLWLIIILGLIAVAIAVYKIGGAYREAEFNRTVNTQTNQANKAVREAVNANASAFNLDSQRKTEDARRETVITPKLGESRRRSNASQTALAAAKRKYENEKLHPQNLNSTDADNCRELRALFPNVNFTDCR